MIHEVFSTLPGFKTLPLRLGLNVLLADRTNTSTERQTRNRAGKSSLVELIHFVLGAKAGKDCIFRNPKLEEFEFGLHFDLGGQLVSARRTGAEPSCVVVEANDTSPWSAKPKSKNGGAPAISNEEWKTLRKSGFLSAFERIVAGKSDSSSYTEVARARWKRLTS
jgi:uncharacterized protein YydD (DUF2326 family)